MSKDVEFYVRNKLTGVVHSVPKHAVGRMIAMVLEMPESTELVNIVPMNEDEVNDICIKYPKRQYMPY